MPKSERDFHAAVAQRGHWQNLSNSSGRPMSISRMFELWKEAWEAGHKEGEMEGRRQVDREGGNYTR